MAQWANEFIGYVDLNGIRRGGLLFTDQTILPRVRGGADDENDQNQDADDNADDNTDDDTSGDDTDDDSSDADSDEDDEDVKKASATAKERMKAADKRASQLQKERDALLKEKKDRDDAAKGDLERAQDRVKELESEQAKQAEEAKNLRIQNAFFAHNTVQWIDPEEALDALDLSEVEIDDNGKVNKKQLGAAIANLAKKKTHWVKDDEDEDGEGSSGASGSQMNGRRKGGESKGPDKATLEKNFPALRNRQV